MLNGRGRERVADGGVFRRDLVTSMAAEVAAVAGAALALAVVTRTRTPFDFGLYSVAMRSVSLFLAPLLIGMGVTLPRILPLITEEGERRRYLMAALAIVALVGLTLVIVLLTSHRYVSLAIFGDPSRTPETVAVVAVLLGGLIYGVVYGYLRGGLLFTQANLLSALNLGAVPLVAALTTHGVAPLLLVTSVGWAIFALLFGARHMTWPAGLGGHIRELLVVGVRRVPGEFALFGLVAVPPLIVLHVQGVTAAGHASLALSMFTIAGTSVAPFSAVLLPHASKWLGEGDSARVASFVKRGLITLISVAAVCVALVELFASWLVPVVFGQASQPVVPAVRLIFLAAPAYAVFILFRSVIDGATARATTMNLTLVCFAIFALVMFGSSLVVRLTLLYVLGVTVVTMWLLATMVMVYVQRLLKP